MAYKDLHDEPFEDTTISKLEIFEDYAQAWIPTFVMQKAPEICIFDFFAGTGYDKNGVPGSPIRILAKIKEQIGHIFQNKTKIKLYVNEFEPNKREQRKFDLLQKGCSDYLDDNKDIKRAIEINYFNEDFKELFPKLVPIIKKNPSLVYLDQNGIKFLADQYLLELEKIGQTDFLYFVSASYFWRFGDSKEFREHINIDMEEAKKNPYEFIHRSLIAQLRKKLPNNSKMRLYPFTLKKGTNIYGIIFGASHPRAVDKFLSIAWKRNETNGEANFDIDNDEEKGQLDIFTGKKLSKIEEFKKRVKDKVMAKEIKNNFDALRFVYAEGHIGNHAAECLKEMKRAGIISFEGNSPLVTYDNVYKNKKKIEYKIL